MKKIFALVLTLAMVLALAACSGGSKPSASNDPATPSASGSAGDGFVGEKIELKLNHNNASTTPTAKAIQAWADEIYEATNGTVKITQYPSDALGSTNSGFDLLDSGIADLQWATCGMFSGVLNYLDTFSLPMTGMDSSEDGTNAIWDVYENGWGEKIQGDFGNARMLIANSSPAGVLGSKVKKTCAADMKGDVVRSIAGGIANWVSACGGSPTFMGPPDIYTNLEKGVIDSYIFEWSGVESFNLAETTPYFLSMNLFRVSQFIMISDSAWAKLSTDQQNAILSVSERTGSLKFAQALDAAEAAYIKKNVDAGNCELVEPTQEAYDEFYSLAQGVWHDYVSVLEDGETYLTAVMDAIAANSK